MSFKTIKTYNEERYGKMFTLRNDGDYADVIFLYQNEDDVLIADTHYIKSADYSGYVHCCGRGCPACAKGIRVQTKLFIPMYNLTSNQIEFFDRTPRFEPQLHHDVFSHYSNPSEYVFRITRKGTAGDVNTTYQIVAVARNTFKSFGQLCADLGVTFPDYYSTICKDLSANELTSMLNAGNVNPETSPMPEYQATPRVAISAAVPLEETIPEPSFEGLDDDAVPFDIPSDSAANDGADSDVDDVTF